MAAVDPSDLHYQWLSPPARRAAVVLGTITGDSRSWPTLYAPLAAQVPMVCMDVRNQGQSIGVGGPASLEEQLQDLSLMLDGAGVREPIWVGNSACTLLACRAAVELPSKALVLLAPLFSFEMRRKVQLLRKALVGATKDTSLLTFHSLLTFLTYGAQYLETHPMTMPVGLSRMRTLFTHEKLRILCEQTFFPEFEDPSILQHVSCPVLVIQPEQEEFMSLEVARTVAQRFVRGQYTSVPCGHGLLEEAPEIAFRLMQTFIDGLTDQPLEELVQC